jgi:putative membrane protein
MWYYGNGPMGWGVEPFGWIFMVIIWILVIMLILAIIRRIGGGHHGYMHMQGQDSLPGEKTPLDILKERYAKGEINKEEFEQKKKDLS